MENTNERKLTLPHPIPDEEKKLSSIFISKLLCGASKGFMKAFEAFYFNKSFRNARDGKG